MTASADPGRRREHDNPRDECGHAGIQQDFVENSNHSSPSHTRLPLHAAVLGYSPAHWTAKCYEFDNKEVRNGTKNGSPRVAVGSPNNAALIIERGHRPLATQSGHRELASSMSAKAKDMRCSERSIRFDHLAGAREQAEREGDAGVTRVDRCFSPLSVRPTSGPSRGYAASPCVDVLIVAEAATACGRRTVGVGKPGGARDGGLSARIAPVHCSFMAPGGSRRHGGGADNNDSGKCYFDEHFHLRVWSGPSLLRRPPRARKLHVTGDKISVCASSHRCDVERKPGRGRGGLRWCARLEADLPTAMNAACFEPAQLRRIC